MTARSLHVIASSTLGGAEGFFLRLIGALHERGEPVAALLRKESEVIPQVPPGILKREVSMATVWSPLSRWGIARTIEALRPDIVQTYMSRASRLTRVPRGRGILHVARLGGYYGLHAFRHAHAWVANTKGLCDYLVRGGMPANRVFHISNFIDPPSPVPAAEVLALRGSWGIPEDAQVLLAVGRLMEVKGHAYLLEAFARLPSTLKGRPLWLVLVGDGPLHGLLHAQARQLGVASRVTWTGWQVRPGPFYQMADLVVFPSLEQEALGNVVLEAWAWRKPLVTTSFAGALELTVHAQDAWRVPCRDPLTLAAGIHTVLEDERFRQALADAGYARVQRDFSRATIVDRYLDLYRSLLS
jgi:glycosyltransferase involved in cell wall biosynthesis